MNLKRDLPSCNTISYMSCAKARQRPPSLLVLMRLSQRLASMTPKYAAVATPEMERTNCCRLAVLRDQVGTEIGQVSTSA
ncbi:hypothetical protein CU669_11840 [Paramagnetospirillum kuznetsovii]|uniref:Uncharacterized protein n=1 Tax=Paramagnetospirillum kuznetsovii TaxID=2053833 RepID=A0A364NX51_9PROT|nr:hypothetical protein CU669_11840 [Paramagnetospirillum kuznetsovii]